MVLKAWMNNTGKYQGRDEVTHPNSQRKPMAGCQAAHNGAQGKDICCSNHKECSSIYTAFSSELTCLRVLLGSCVTTDASAAGTAQQSLVPTALEPKGTRRQILR